MEYPVLDAKATGARIRELRKERHLKVDDILRGNREKDASLSLLFSRSFGFSHFCAWKAASAF